VLAAHAAAGEVCGRRCTVAELQAATTRDKKNRADGVRFVVINSLGAAATRAGIPPATVEAVWRELGAV
jgi:3-dehydroquinate synthetase